MAAVASIGCIMAALGYRDECSGRVEVHHLREGVGAAQRQSDWLTIPVCHAHHTEHPFGVHLRKAFQTRTKLDELDLLAETIRRLEIRGGA
jgi:hypothetical protein